MTFFNQADSDDHGRRVAGFVLRVTREQIEDSGGFPKELQTALGGAMCWSSAVLCAWAARGIRLDPPPGYPALPPVQVSAATAAAAATQSDPYSAPPYPEAMILGCIRMGVGSLVTGNSYDNLFSTPVAVGSSTGIANIPIGAFVGFLSPAPQSQLLHVMIYVGDGMATGSNNGSMFEHKRTAGYQLLNLHDFYTGNAYVRRHVRLIYQRVHGQLISR